MALEGTILSIEFDLFLPLCQSFSLKSCFFTSDFDWSVELGVFTVSAVAALQPTIGPRS